jgi:hypothetical protein
LAVILALVLSLGVGLTPAAARPIPTIYSNWASTIPTIDGAFGTGEWSDAAVVDFQAADTHNPLEAYAYFKNDADFLYIGFDVPGDISADDGDVTTMSFDTGHDGVYTDGHDDTFAIGQGTTYHFVRGSGTHCSPFDTGQPLHGGLAGDLGFGTSPNSGADHRIYEYCLPLALLLASAGDTLGFGMDGDIGMGIYDQSSGPGDQWPFWRGAAIYISEYGDLVLASPPVGGELYPVNKLGILTPWIGAAMLLVGGLTWFALRRRRAYN